MRRVPRSSSVWEVLPFRLSFITHDSEFIIPIHRSQACQPASEPPSKGFFRGIQSATTGCHSLPPLAWHSGSLPASTRARSKGFSRRRIQSAATGCHSTPQPDGHSGSMPSIRATEQRFLLIRRHSQPQVATACHSPPGTLAACQPASEPPSNSFSKNRAI